MKKNKLKIKANWDKKLTLSDNEKIQIKGGYQTDVNECPQTEVFSVCVCPPRPTNDCGDTGVSASPFARTCYIF